MKLSLTARLGCWCATIIFILTILACWVSNNLQNVFVPYANVTAFLALVILFFTHIDFIKLFHEKDRELLLLTGGCLLAAINMIIIKSNVGAIFTIVNFFIILYLSDKVTLPKSCICCLALTCAGVAVYWFLIKRCSYNNCDFNTNGAACILFSLIVCSVCSFHYLFCKLKWKDKYWGVAFVLVLSLLFWQSFHFLARCVMIGTGALMITYYLIPKQKWTVYAVLICSLAFPAVYVLVWKAGFGNIQLFNKNLMSGREEIWYEFFQSYIKYPITGIGSDFERMVSNEVLLEVHHALLDILFVHGLPVFLIVLYFMLKRLRGLFTYINKRKMGLYISVLYGMMVIGIFENYYITSPYSIIFFIILILSYQYGEDINVGLDELVTRSK